MNIDRAKVLIEPLSNDEIKEICRPYFSEEILTKNIRWGTLDGLLLQGLCYQIIPQRALLKSMAS